MKIDKKTLAFLKEKGVSPDILLDLVLEDDPAPAPEADPATEEPAPEVKPATMPEQKNQDPVLAAIEKLTGAVQLMNVRGLSMEIPKKESTDDILASVLAGPRPEGGK